MKKREALLSFAEAVKNHGTCCLQIANEYKESLRKLYGNQFVELILFPSYARNEQHDESDIDFAIVLKNPQTRHAGEIEKTSVISSCLSLKYGISVSSLPITTDKKQSSMQGIYQEIRKEGIVI